MVFSFAAPFGDSGIVPALRRKEATCRFESGPTRPYFPASPLARPHTSSLAHLATSSADTEYRYEGNRETRSTRGPRPHRALAEAVPIAKARGIVQMTLSGPERIFDIAIISKVPVTFARVMFAPAILATIHELTDEFKEEIAQLRVIARDAAITAELWIRSKHGTWRFFLVTPDFLVEIDREGKRLESGQTVAYGAGTPVSDGGES